MNQELLEPLKYYNTYLKDAFNRNVESFFDELVKTSEIDIEENRKTIKKYKEKKEESVSIGSRINKLKNIKGFLIFLISICFGGIIFYFINRADNYRVSENTSLIVLIVSIILLITSFFVIFNYLKPKIRDNEKIRDKIDKDVLKLMNKGYEEMEALNSLYDSDDTRQLIIKTLPDITFDQNFNMKRFDYLSGKYGLKDCDGDINSSSLKIISGDIVGNPYAIVKKLRHYIGRERYEGSITIHWVEYVTDSEGNRKAVQHSQVLTATVEKPKPFYYNNFSLIYGNEAASNLSFSRAPTLRHDVSDSEIDKIVKRGKKELEKKAKRAIKNGDNFTALGNDEFEVLFGALNRDNETEFRLLFTPLAQSNMINLIRNSPYGDYFSFFKDKMINTIEDDCSVSWNLDTSKEHFRNFDYDDARAKYLSFNNDYFKHYFFILAPILSIPLYQQYKPQEYIYEHEYKRNYTSFQAEVMANFLGENCFCHPNTETSTILKTRFLSKEGKTDNVEVTAYSYYTENRTDYVSVYGGDGHYHEVPVNWVEYIPLVNTSSMKMKEINLRESQLMNMTKDPDFDKVEGIYDYKDGILALKGNNTAIDSIIDKLVNKYKGE